MLVPRDPRQTLVPQNPHHQQVCPRCGRLPAYLASTCPSCGMQLVLPWPDQNSGPYPWTLYPPFTIPQPPNYTPLIVEMLLNFIGIYGVGWLMAGNLAGGAVLLIVSLMLWPVVALVGIFTMGLGLLCLGPLAIVAMVINLVVLQQAIKCKACC
jgi:hypothetical protein